MSARRREVLASALARDDFTIEELVEALSDLGRGLVPKQTRYKVTDRPDVRTIRYYTSQRLLPKPVSYEGGRARYSGSHLLRLLLIKKLQAEHHTLARISQRLADAGDREILDQLTLDESQTEASELSVAGSAPKRTQKAVQHPAKATSRSKAVRRFEFDGGATVDVPQNQLDDPARRVRLARELESLARALRAGQDDRDDEREEES